MLTREQYELCGKIAERATRIIREWNKSTVFMDLVTIVEHGNVNLDLHKMATTKFTIDLIHDIAGINRNLNRQDGTFNNDFLPRFSLA